MSNKKLAMVVLAVFAAVCIVGLVALHVVWQVVFGPTPEYRKGAVWQELKLERYIQTHSQMAPGDVLTFEWDEAYIDRRPYGTGETVQQLTGYAFEVKALNDEYWNRLLFFKDGQLVKELVYSWFEWEFPVELLGFTPQTVFRIEANAPRYALSVAEGYEGTAVWQEEGEAAQKAEGGAQSEARASSAA